MLDPNIELSLVEIYKITPVWLDDGGSVEISMQCTLTKECLSWLEGRLLYELRRHNLADVGICGLAEYISHIGREEFNKQLAVMGYETILTREKSAELFDIVDGKKHKE